MASASLLVEELEEFVSGELNLLVAPLGGSIPASDEAHPMESPEIAVDKGVPSLGLIGSTYGEPEMPL